MTCTNWPNKAPFSHLRQSEMNTELGFVVYLGSVDVSNDNSNIIVIWLSCYQFMMTLSFGFATEEGPNWMLVAVIFITSNLLSPAAVKLEV